MGWRLGVDTGGTFTDVVLADDTGLAYVAKVPSNRADPSVAIRNGVETILASAAVPSAEVEYFGHGTTVAINAVLEGTTARAGIIITRGFAGILDLARQRRPDLYDMDVLKPEPVVPRERRFELDERLSADGAVVTPVDETEVRTLAGRLLEAGVEVVAICLLHSYVNPAHEREVGRILAEAAPQIAVTLSSDVHPEMREFDRFSTTAVNAALVPVMSGYLTRLTSAVEAAGVPSSVQVIQSNGGVMSAAAAAARPVATLFSGPSAGVMGAARICAQAGEANIITFDMGGTSTDVALVSAGVVPIVHKRDVAARPVMGATVDIHSVGSGGGSIGWIDAGGLLKVGPRSAGAQPGPACYGRGGDLPTVTDANAVLGYLNPDTPLGGTLTIDVDAARDAIDRVVARPLGLSIEQAAVGMLRVLQADLTRAVRTISVERGSDPRDFVLVPFGGAGGLHASLLARELRIPKLLVPPSPGVLCAYGALTADPRTDFSATCLAEATPAGTQAVNEIIDRLSGQAAGWFAAERLDGGAARYEWTLEMLYAHQNSPLRIRIDGPLTAATMADAVATFHEEYRERYGYSTPQHPVQVTTVRLAAMVPISNDPFAEPVGGTPMETVRRPVYFEGPDAYVDCPVADRASLTPEDVHVGPAIIRQPDATTVVLPGQKYYIDAFANLIIED